MGVSWFEAEAYANWLSAQWGKPVRLPREEEWERAARGVTRREYAWGNEFDRKRLNCAAFWKNDDDADWVFDVEGSTTIVGQFPVGSTPDGICDLSGNMWEWTASWYEPKQDNRVLRGGSWGSNRGSARCAARYRLVPALFSLNVGFRLLSPGIFLDSGC